MDLSEVGKLLAVASAYDNRQLREETAMAWKAALDMQLPDLTSGMAQQIVVWWFSEPREYFTVGHLVDEAKRRLRLRPEQVEADVRVAKSLGLVDESHPRGEPLPEREAARLAQVRADRASEQLALSELKQLEPGAVA